MNVSTDLPVGGRLLIDVLCSNWMRGDPHFLIEESDQLFKHFSISSDGNTPLLVKDTSLRLDSPLKVRHNLDCPFSYSYTLYLQ